MYVKDGPINPLVNLLHEYTEYLVDGLVPTDGIQYSSVATVGTTAVEIFTKLITPGVKLAVKQFEVGLTQRFNNLLTNSVASLDYYWEARRESVATIDSYHTLTGTYTKGVPTSGVAGDPAEDSFSGYIPVGTLFDTPLRLRLVAVGLKASAFTGEVKNSSFVRLVGTVIPGT